MNSIPTPQRPRTPVPLGRAEFKQKLLSLTKVQFLTLLVHLTIYASADRIGLIELQMGTLITLFLAELFILKKLVPNIQARLLDIYPDLLRSRLVAVTYLFALSYPVLFPFVLAFLLGKEPGSSHQQIPFFLKTPKYLAIFLLLIFPFSTLIMQNAFFVMRCREPVSISLDHSTSVDNPTEVSFWFFPPINQYFSSFFREVSFVKRTEQELFRIAQQKENTLPIINFLDRNNISSYGLMSLSSYFSDPLLRPWLQSQVSLLVSSIQAWERQPPMIYQFNPLSVLTPYGAVEVTAITAAHLSVEILARAKITGEVVQYLQERLKDPTVDHIQVAQLLQKLTQTKAYRRLKFASPDHNSRELSSVKQRI